MTDTRIEQLADILVDYSTRIRDGDEVQLFTAAPLGLPLLRACYRRVIERGAHVYMHVGFEDERELFFKHASDAQLKHFPDLLYEETKRATAYIRIDAEQKYMDLPGPVARYYVQRKQLPALAAAITGGAADRIGVALAGWLFASAKGGTAEG